MKSLLLFAASRDQLNYFLRLIDETKVPAKVVWYKHVWKPALMKAVPWQSIKQQVDILHRRKAIRLKRRPHYLVFWLDFIKALWLYSVYIKLLRSNAAQTVGVWNGKKFRQAILVIAAKALEKELLYFETGPLPGYSVVDPVGVDFYSSVPREVDFYRECHCEHFKGDEKPSLSNFLLFDSPYVFIPFQVIEDSNIYLHSPWVNDMRHFFSLIERLSDMFPNKRFLIKTHPACPENYDDLYAKAEESNGRLQFVSDVDTSQLVAHAEAVITINSTVGMEALIAHKKLLVLGEAIYGIDGLVKLVRSETELIDAFSELNSWKLDENLIEYFLCYLQRDYAVVGDAMRQPGKAHWQAMDIKLQRMLSDEPLKAIGL